MWIERCGIRDSYTIGIASLCDCTAITICLGCIYLILRTAKSHHYIFDDLRLLFELIAWIFVDYAFDLTTLFSHTSEIHHSLTPQATGPKPNMSSDIPHTRDFARRPSTSSSTTHVDATAPPPTTLHRIPTIEDVVNLPLRTLSNDANLDEYTQETLSGALSRDVVSPTGTISRYELVTFTLDDAANPKNWSKAKKWWCTMCVAITCFAVAFNSAVVTADLGGVSAEFGVSEEVSLLTITLFVVGFGIGPMAFAPLSEIFGRRPVYAVTLAVAVVFTIPGALARNIETLLITRFIAGVAFSAPMSLVGGTLVSLFLVEGGCGRCVLTLADRLICGEMRSVECPWRRSVLPRLLGPASVLSLVASCLTPLAGDGCTGFN